jgi:hypothetical protein
MISLVEYYKEKLEAVEFEKGVSTEEEKEDSIFKTPAQPEAPSTSSVPTQTSNHSSKNTPDLSSFNKLTKSICRFFALGTDKSKFIETILKKIVLERSRVTPEDLDETNVVELKGDEDEDLKEGQEPQTIDQDSQTEQKDLAPGLPTGLTQVVHSGPG